MQRGEVDHARLVQDEHRTFRQLRQLRRRRAGEPAFLGQAPPVSERDDADKWSYAFAKDDLDWGLARLREVLGVA